MNRLNRLTKNLGLAMGLALSLVLVACGGGSGGSISLGTDGGGTGGTTLPLGKLQIALTDAEDDFLTYRVQINSIRLVAAGGTEISLLSQASEIDFVQYQSLSELFAVRDVPEGRYDQILLELDYSNADIVIQDENGVAYNAVALDSSGNPITNLTLELSFGDAETVRITPGRIANLTLDLDLSASNEILGFNPAQVEVSPVVVATAELDNQREHRVRGLLQSVDASAGTIELDLRPLRMSEGRLGEVVVETNADTLFNINGNESTGAVGLAELAALAVDTAVIGFGALDAVSGNLLLSRVNAGERSTDMRDQDVAKGVVIARDGNQLTLAAVVIETGDGAARFRSRVTLTLGEDTLITGYRLGDATSATPSVGQSLLALGSFEALDDQQGSMDATNGSLLLRNNSINGTVVNALPLSLSLERINRLSVDRFDFSGTGSDPLNDADPANYEIRTGSLNTSNLVAGEWIQVQGYPTAFASAPVDFDATQIRDPDETSLKASLAVLWTDEASATIELDGLDLLLNTEQARVQFRVEGKDRLLPLLRIEAPVLSGTESRGRYSIETRPGRSVTFRDYNSFVAQLNSLLAEREVRKVSAIGEFDATTERLTARSIVVRFKPLFGGGE